MIFNYNTYRFNNLLKESTIYYTNDFKNILLNLKDKNEIAGNLLDVERKDVKPDMTFISLGEKEGDIKFTQINKIKNYIKNSENLNKTYSDNHIDILLNQLEKGSLVDRIVNVLYDEDSNIRNKSRNSTGVGRLVNQIFPGKFTSKEVEDFVYLFKNLNKPKTYEFKLAKGEDIKKYYLVDNYAFPDKGDLGNSCMRYQRCQEYLNIYTENPNQVQLLVYVDQDDKVLGRALMWTLPEDKLEGYNYFMDRIYSYDNSINILFEEYSEKNNILRRTGYTDNAKIGDKIIHFDIGIKLDKSDFEYYPYMDTFKVLIGKYLYNNKSDSDEGYNLESTHGEYEDLSGVWSDKYDCRIDRDQAVWSDDSNTYLLEDDAVEITVGWHRHLGWYDKESYNIVHDLYRDTYIHLDDAMYSELTNCYYLDDDNLEVYSGIYRTVYNSSFQFTSSNVSEKCEEYTNWQKLDCVLYLNSLELECYNFWDDMIEYNSDTKKYFIKELKVKLYETKYGPVSEQHCELLGIEMGKLVRTTDMLYYLYNNPVLKDLLKLTNDKIDYYENIINGGISRIKYEDDENYIDKLIKLLPIFKKEKELFEKWI